MFRRFDDAISQALSSEHGLFGTSDRSIATATARRAAAENRVKAMNEATLGKSGFAALHDTASSRFHDDAELMMHGQPPVHHSISFYLSMAESFAKADARRIEATEPVCNPAPERAHAA